MPERQSNLCLDSLCNFERALLTPWCGQAYFLTIYCILRMWADLHHQGSCPLYKFKEDIGGAFILKFPSLIA